MTQSQIVASAKQLCRNCEASDTIPVVLDISAVFVELCHRTHSALIGRHRKTESSATKNARQRQPIFPLCTDVR